MIAPLVLSHSALNEIADLDEAARAELVRVLLLSLTGLKGLALIFAAMAQVDAHADEIYRFEFEKES